MAVIGTLDGQGTLSTTARRRLQLFRNTTNLANATAAKQAITGQTLLDGEVIIARYKEDGKEQQGVLAIKGIGDDYVYFDSAALQSVSGGTGISVTDKENNSQTISLDIADAELSNGAIEVKDGEGKKIFEITGVDAANVTYDNADDKVIKDAETTSEAIKELDAALDAANKANLSGATVTAENNVATVTLEDSAKNPLASFTVGSSDNNLEVAKATGEGITLDIKSVGATASDGTGTVNGDTTATDALTQQSYVDNEISKAIKNGTVSVATGKAETATGTAVFEPKANTNDYYVHLTAGDNVYNIKLEADDFVKDAFLASATIVQGPVEGEPTASEKAKYFKFVWKTDKGAEGEEITETTYIKTSDILGDLVGGDGIDFNGSNIAIDLADQSGFVQLSLDGDTDGERQLNVNVTTGETTFNKDAEGDAKKWSVAEGKDGLTTATEVVKVANDLQGQIDELSSQTITGSNAISADTKDGETKVSLVLDSKTIETDEIGGVTAGQVVTNASNALCVTADGLYLSNIWDCGTF